MDDPSLDPERQRFYKKEGKMSKTLVEGVKHLLALLDEEELELIAKEIDEMVEDEDELNDEDEGGNGRIAWGAACSPDRRLGCGVLRQ